MSGWNCFPHSSRTLRHGALPAESRRTLCRRRAHVKPAAIIFDKQQYHLEQLSFFFKITAEMGFKSARDSALAAGGAF
jgi:hypothetical protein